MQINLTTDYAVRVVLHLAARSGEGRCLAADISREQCIPMNYVPKVLQGLARAGIVATSAGRSGGARLLKSPYDISILDILEGMEGPTALNRCLLREGECSREHFCPVHDVWAVAQKDLVKRLKDTTIGGLLKK